MTVIDQVKDQKDMSETIYYHFTGTHLRDGREIPAIGEWITEVAAEARAAREEAEKKYRGWFNEMVYAAFEMQKAAL